MTKVIKIDGVDYAPVSEIQKTQETSLKGMKYVIIRTNSAGVHAGYLEKREGKEVTLRNSRRLYYWDGAFTLSTIATKGVSKPENCKFPDIVPEILLTEAVEVIPCTEEARVNIKDVPVWKNS